MKKVFIVSLLTLIAVISLASCSEKLDPTLLPEPEIRFKAVKETLGTGIRIDIINLKETMNEFSASPEFLCQIEDEEGNVLFTKEGTSLNMLQSPLVTMIDDVEAGEELTCTVTFYYEGFSTSATATDTVI